MEAIKQEPYEIVDTDFGDIVSCEAVPHDKDSGSFSKNLGTGCMSGNPLYSPWSFRVTYANGVQAVVEGRGWMVMSSQGLPGFIEKRPEGLKDSPRWRDRYGNARLMATIAAKIRDCGYFPTGPVELIPSDQVEAVFKDCGVRNRPCDIDDEWLAKVEKEWPERWLKAGLVVKPNPDQPFVEAKWWWAMNLAEEARQKAEDNMFLLCDGRKVRKEDMTEDDWHLIADPNDCQTDATEASNTPSQVTSLSGEHITQADDKDLFVQAMTEFPRWLEFYYRLNDGDDFGDGVLGEHVRGVMILDSMLEYLNGAINPDDFIEDRLAMIRKLNRNAICFLCEAYNPNQAARMLPQVQLYQLRLAAIDMSCCKRLNATVKTGSAGVFKLWIVFNDDPAKRVFKILDPADGITKQVSLSTLNLPQFMEEFHACGFAQWRNEYGNFWAHGSPADDTTNESEAAWQVKYWYLGDFQYDKKTGLTHSYPFHLSTGWLGNTDYPETWHHFVRIIILLFDALPPADFKCYPTIPGISKELNLLGKTGFPIDNKEVN